MSVLRLADQTDNAKDAMELEYVKLVTEMAFSQLVTILQVNGKMNSVTHVAPLENAWSVEVLAGHEINMISITMPTTWSALLFYISNLDFSGKRLSIAVRMVFRILS